MSMRLFRGALYGACLAVALSSSAQAAFISKYVGADFTKSPANPTGSYSFGYDNSNDFTFTDVSGGISFNPDAVGVSTSGGGSVTAIKLFTPDYVPTNFQDPRGGFNTSEFGPNTFFPFVAFPTTTAIPSSASTFIIGLKDVVGGETHYGYGEFKGTELVSYAFQSTPDAAIVTGVPLPASAPMFGAALMALVGLRRAVSRKRAASARA